MKEAAMSSNANCEVPTRSWADLPREILSEISDCLGVIELICFRSSCKSFLSASSTATALIQSAKFPWFLFSREETSECRLYNLSEEKSYTLNLPELDGTTCLASLDGWLLLLKEKSIFFFCPVSRAKISLPDDGLLATAKDSVGSFSSLPTELDCIVTVLSRPNPFIVEFNVIHRGDTKWTSYSSFCPHLMVHLGIIRWTMFSEWGAFCYVDDKASGVYYTVEATATVKPLVACKILKVESEEEEAIPTERNEVGFPRRMPYAVQVHDALKAMLNLREDESLTTCGTVVPIQRGEVLPIYNETIMAPNGSSDGRHSKGIWIQPRYFRVAADQSW